MEYKKCEENPNCIMIGENGYPIVIDESGSEFELDAIYLFNKVPNLIKEAKEYRDTCFTYRKIIGALGVLINDDIYQSTSPLAKEITYSEMRDINFKS